MARHNYLIQRYVTGDNNGNPSLGVRVEWMDNGPFDGTHRRDSFGNMGHATIEEAREAIQFARKTWPQNTYRIIQIVS